MFVFSKTNKTIHRKIENERVKVYGGKVQLSWDEQTNKNRADNVRENIENSCKKNIKKTETIIFSTFRVEKN